MNTLPHTVYVLYITAEGELSIINTPPQTLSAIYIYRLKGGGGGEHSIMNTTSNTL